MKETTNKQEIIKRLNEAFKNGEFELSSNQQTRALIYLLNALSEMHYTNVEKASEIINSIPAIDND